MVSASDHCQLVVAQAGGALADNELTRAVKRVDGYPYAVGSMKRSSRPRMLRAAVYV